jgi:protein SCO1/2
VVHQQQALLLQQCPLHGQQNSLEQWNLSNGRDWSHPVHVRMEEHQVTRGAPGLYGSDSDDHNNYSRWSSEYCWSGCSSNTSTGVNLSRKDTVRLLPRSNAVIKMRFRDWVGRYPLHCHNVIHEDHAMMLRFDVAKTVYEEQPLSEKKEHAMLGRRKLFEGLALVPVAGAIACATEQRKVAAVASPTAAPPPTPGTRRFPPPLSGREMMRTRFFPNVELVTSKGEKVKFYEDLLKDKIVILNMMYAHCNGICPTTTANLKTVRKILRDEINHDIFVYSITVKPEEDSPADLVDYARMHQIDDPQWLFLTGKPDDVDLIRHKVGFSDPNPDVDRDKARHSGMVRYGNEPLAIWGSCQGSAEPSWMAQEIGFAVPREFKRHARVND